MTEILLVRHGESEWNALGRWQGQADVPLSDLGRSQAIEASRALGTVDAVIASDLERAATTAAIVAEQLGIGPVYLDPDLRERSAGEWSGLTRAEIHERYPGYLPDDPNVSAFAAGALTRRPPGWEPDDDLSARALRAIDRMVAAVPDGTVLAVSHGGLIMAVEQQLGADAGRIGNLEARWLVAAHGRLTLGERVKLLDPDIVATTLPEGI